MVAQALNELQNIEPADGRQTGVHFANGSSRTSQFDAAGQLVAAHYLLYYLLCLLRLHQQRGGQNERTRRLHRSFRREWCR